MYNMKEHIRTNIYIDVILMYNMKELMLDYNMKELIFILLDV